MADDRNRNPAVLDEFSRLCERLEQRILDETVRFMMDEGNDAALKDLAWSLPTVHAGLLLRYLMAAAPSGASARELAVLMIDETIRGNGKALREIADTARRGPH